MSEALLRVATPRIHVAGTQRDSTVFNDSRLRGEREDLREDLKEKLLQFFKRIDT
jgi:hypothetical protein